MACFQTIRPDIQLEQRVAIEAVGRGATLVVIFTLVEIEVVFGEILDQVLRQNAQIAHRHAVLRIGPARGVGQRCVLHTQFAGALCHEGGETILGAGGGQAFGHDNTGVIAGIHDDPQDQFAHGGAVLFIEEHGGAAHGAGAGRYGEGRLHRDRATVQRLEQHVERHQLGHRGGRQRRFRILGQKHRARGLVQHPGRSRTRVKGLRRCGGQQQGQKRSGDQAAQTKRGETRHLW